MRSKSLCAKNGSIQITSTDNFLRLKNLTEGQGSAQRRIKMPVLKVIKTMLLCPLFSSLRRYRQTESRGSIPLNASAGSFFMLGILKSKGIEIGVGRCVFSRFIRGGRTLVFDELHLDIEFCGFVVAINPAQRQSKRIADLALLDEIKERIGVVKVFAVHCDDHIACLRICIGEVTVGTDTLDNQGAGGQLLELDDHSIAGLLARRIIGDAELRPSRDIAIGNELIDNFLCRIDRNGKADSLIAFCDLGGIDADDLAVHIDERTAGVAGVCLLYTSPSPRD